MKKAVCLSVIFCVACALLSPANALAQDKSIQVTLKLEGKEVQKPFKILLSVEGSAIFEPPITDGSFMFPPELKSYEKVNLRLLYKEYDLDYGDVYLTKFDGEMVFGVDNAPFDEEHINGNPSPEKELLLIYFLESVGTVLTTFIYK